MTQDTGTEVCRTGLNNTFRLIAYVKGGEKEALFRVESTDGKNAYQVTAADALALTAIATKH